MISNILTIGSLNEQPLSCIGSTELKMTLRRNGLCIWLLLEILENELGLTWSLYCILGKKEKRMGKAYLSCFEYTGPGSLNRICATGGKSNRLTVSSGSAVLP